MNAENSTERTDKNLMTNFLAVLVSGAVTGVLGLIFWAAIGRLYPAATVGTANALINTAVMVSTLASSSIGTMYERFLPLAHGQALNLIRLGQIAVALFAATASALMIGLGPSSELLSSNWQFAAFLLFTVTTASFALQDHIVTGMNVARWGAYKNIVHAVMKLTLVVLLASTVSTWVIIGSWWAPAVVCTATLALCVRRRLLRTMDTSRRADLPQRRALWSYFAGSAGILAVGTAVPLIVPLIVVARYGVAQNAYFAVAWSMVSAAVIVLHMLIGPFVAEAADADGTRTLALLRRFTQLLAAATLIGSAGLAAIGPFVLGVVGESYRSNGAVLLFYAAAVLPLTCVFIVYQALARVTRRLRLAVFVQLLNAGIVLGGITFSDTSGGLSNVGLWFLIGESVSATIASVAMFSAIRRIQRTAIVADQIPPTAH
jgi:O-antigen/teichoic acid export membrane protein